MTRYERVSNPVKLSCETYFKVLHALSQRLELVSHANEARGRRNVPDRSQCPRMILRDPRPEANGSGQGGRGRRGAASGDREGAGSDGSPIRNSGSPTGPLSGSGGFPRHDLTGVSKKPVKPRLVSCCSGLVHRSDGLQVIR